VLSVLLGIFVKPNGVRRAGNPSMATPLTLQLNTATGRTNSNDFAIHIFTEFSASDVMSGVSPALAAE
jgi:hypothetical protein